VSVVEVPVRIRQKEHVLVGSGRSQTGSAMGCASPDTVDPEPPTPSRSSNATLQGIPVRSFGLTSPNHREAALRLPPRLRVRDGSRSRENASREDSRMGLSAW
jgi:hypothetical protein